MEPDDIPERTKRVPPTLFRPDPSSPSTTSRIGMSSLITATIGFLIGLGVCAVFGAPEVGFFVGLCVAGLAARSSHLR